MAGPLPEEISPKTTRLHTLAVLIVALLAVGIFLVLWLGGNPDREELLARAEKYSKQKKWEQAVKDVVARLIGALEPEDVVLGGGNVNNLKKLPSGCRAGNNADAFVGGFRCWQKIKRHNRSASRSGKP